MNILIRENLLALKPHPSAVIHQSRLRQFIKPRPPQCEPIRMRGAAGSASAGGARADGPHVSLACRNRSGVAGGDHGYADVHTGLFRQR